MSDPFAAISRTPRPIAVRPEQQARSTVSDGVVSGSREPSTIRRAGVRTPAAIMPTPT